MRWKAMLATAVVLVLLLFLVVMPWIKPHQDYSTGSRRAWSLFRQGDQDFEAFRWPNAEQALREAVQADPSFAMARAALAQVQASRGLAAEAKATATAAESLALRLPDGPERWVVLLRLANVDKRFVTRRDSLATLLAAKRPDDIWLARTRAAIAADRLDLAGEESAWKDVLRIEPNAAEAYNQLGYLAARFGRYEEARSYLKKYAYLAPQLANPHDSLGEILTYTGDYAEAEAEFKQALKIQPDFFPSLINLAGIYVERGEMRRGIDLYGKVRAQIAGTEWEKRVDEALIGAYYDNGLEAQLRVEMGRWIVAHPQDPSTPFYRAIALAARGRYAEGRAVCDSLLAAARTEPYYRASETYRRNVERLEHNYPAIVAHLSGDAAREAQEYGEIVRLMGPALPPHQILSWRLRLGVALERLGRHADALEQAQRILAVNPRRLNALALEARALLALGRADASREALARLRASLTVADRDYPAALAADSLAARLAAPRPR